MTSIVLKNCTLLNSDSPELQENIHILITDDRITEVSETPIKSSTAHVIDVKGKTVMPGLIDAHVHLGQLRFGEHGMTPSTMLRWMDRHGIEQAIVMAVEVPEELDYFCLLYTSPSPRD